MTINYKPIVKPIGIFGGAFDPIHLGHLRAALEILEKFALEILYFVPCHVPVHKAPTVVTAAHRLAMLELAIAGEAKFRVDDREIRRQTPSYMIETLSSFREELGVDRPIALILGTDALIGFTAWRDWEKFFDLAHIIVVARGNQAMKLSPELKGYLSFRKSKSPRTIVNSPAGSVFFQRTTKLNISSSAIRSLILKKTSPRYLIPETVWEYIQREQLYNAL